MQWTGRFANNKTEIFEDDVIQVGEYGFKGRVIYNQSHYEVIDSEGDGNWLDNIMMDGSEIFVKGNFWEHPERL
jgi:hypothetical protein